MAKYKVDFKNLVLSLITKCLKKQVETNCLFDS